MRRALWPVAATVVLAAATALPAAPTAGAPLLGCGSVVTGNVVLTSDITGCARDGLVVGRSNTRIDLNGFTISGTKAVGTAGIRVNGHDDVTITSSAPFAAVVEFDVGIRAAHTRRLAVSGITTQAVQFGLRLEHSAAARILGNNLGFAELVPDCAPASAPAGIRLLDSHRTTIRDNAAQLSGFGILLIQSNANTVRGNGAAPDGSDGNSCSGIALVSSDRNVVLANRVTENRGAGPGAGDGIVVDKASGANVVRENTATTNSDDGIDVRNATTRLVANIANDNDGLGIESVPGVAASGNSAQGNGDPQQCLNVACT
jgi:parallel beta-helix repeat protein